MEKSLRDNWRDNLILSASQAVIHDEGSVYNVEGRHIAYQCLANKTTIGYGRNIDKNGGLGLSEDEAQYLLRTDIRRVFYECVDTVWSFYSLTNRRQVVLINMCFQLGFTSFKTFKKMLAALKVANFDAAADEMLDSKWAKQTPGRAKRLAETMRAG